MKNLSKKLFISAIALAPLFATAETITSTASISLVEPIIISPTGSMAFGQVFKSSTSGTVIADKDGNLTGTLTRNSNLGSPATFEITANPANQVNVSFSDNGNETGIAFSNFTSSFPETGDNFTDAFTTTVTDGFQELAVGATLTVDSSALTGTRSPSFDMVINYQ